MASPSRTSPPSPRGPNFFAGNPLLPRKQEKASVAQLLSPPDSVPATPPLPPLSSRPNSALPGSAPAKSPLGVAHLLRAVPPSRTSSLPAHYSLPPGDVPISSLHGSSSASTLLGTPDSSRSEPSGIRIESNPIRIEPQVLAVLDGRVLVAAWSQRRLPSAAVAASDDVPPTKARQSGRATDPVTGSAAGSAVGADALASGWCLAWQPLSSFEGTAAAGAEVRGGGGGGRGGGDVAGQRLTASLATPATPPPSPDTPAEPAVEPALAAPAKTGAAAASIARDATANQAAENEAAQGNGSRDNGGSGDGGGGGERGGGREEQEEEGGPLLANIASAPLSPPPSSPSLCIPPSPSTSPSPHQARALLAWHRRRASVARVGRAAPCEAGNRTASSHSPPICVSIPSLPPPGARLLAWHRSARFCGTCGARTAPCEAGNRRLCPVAACRSKLYPRIDPVVIMLVVHARSDRVLLARQHRFPDAMWSCLAGFMEPGESFEEAVAREPGESLEEAVAREVREEVGLCITHTRYHSSQPWPGEWRGEGTCTEQHSTAYVLLTHGWRGREVREEVGLCITHTRYHSTQPWPGERREEERACVPLAVGFSSMQCQVMVGHGQSLLALLPSPSPHHPHPPVGFGSMQCQLMVGFYAFVDDTAVTLNTHELQGSRNMGACLCMYVCGQGSVCALLLEQ
ncbi:unnamed protein product [Closterium sp. NIES-64]|nr:unnamed protein product [Closterium sp. NIES-64]